MSLAACAAEPGGDVAPVTSDEPSAAASSTPTPSPAASAFVLPATCEDMIGDELDQEVAGTDLEVVNASGPEVTEDTWDGSEEFVLLGELGAAACGYHFAEGGGGVDGTGQVYTVAAMSPAQEETVTALLEDGDYEMSEEDGRTIYVHAGSFGETADPTVVHELADGVWLSGRRNAGEVGDVQRVVEAIAVNVGAW
jgi:hypothetical protein